MQNGNELRQTPAPAVRQPFSHARNPLTSLYTHIDIYVCVCICMCMYSIVIHTSSKAANFVKRTCKIKSRLDSISMSSKLVGHLVGVAKCHHRCQLPTSCPTPSLPHSPPALLSMLMWHTDKASTRIRIRFIAVCLHLPCPPSMSPPHAPVSSSPASANLYLKTLEIEIATALA